MPNFSEANQVRLGLKMKLSNFAWYNSSHIEAIDDGFSIIVSLKHLDNKIRKIIPPVIDGTSIKIEVEQNR